MTTSGAALHSIGRRIATSTCSNGLTKSHGRRAAAWSNVTCRSKSTVNVQGSNDAAASSSKKSARKADIQRDFFFDVLNVNATRRDAKQYLSHFKSNDKTSQTSTKPDVIAQPRPRSGVNLGRLYGPTRAIESSPLFQQNSDESDTAIPAERHQYHVALVNIRSVADIDDQTLDGIALTLSQLVRLGVRIVAVIDRPQPKQDDHDGIAALKDWYRGQGDRLVKAISQHNVAGAQFIESALSIRPQEHSSDTSAVKVFASIPDLLLRPLARASIAVVPCLVYTETCQAVPATRVDVLSGLTVLLSSVVDATSVGSQQPKVELSLDRIVIVEPEGGIPSQERTDGAHVFVNLEQEYDDIMDELHAARHAQTQQHKANLTDLKTCLDLLPSTSSALVVSPQEAANSSQPNRSDNDHAGIRTRRQRNPLIHNLLTNRPSISSSLPGARLGPIANLEDGDKTYQTLHPTLVKKGMPLAIIPRPKPNPWQPPPSGTTDIALEQNTSIDFPRLLALIEDSFRRKLDVERYLARVQGSIAGVIIAGEYEGGAILTWEAPPGSNKEPARLVPYLDKFAVLQRSQGNAGVADIVFQAMVRSCFPTGVCWRSRSNNPVNKWYFERSVGSWKLPGGEWTMFWTTPNADLVLDPRKWADYVAVCRGVVPTWADGKKEDKRRG